MAATEVNQALTRGASKNMRYLSAQFTQVKNNLTSAGYKARET